MNAQFTILWARFTSINDDECDSLEEAINRLESIEDEGYGCSVAVIDNTTKEMVHFNEFIGKEDAQKEVDTYLSLNK